MSPSLLSDFAFTRRMRCQMDQRKVFSGAVLWGEGEHGVSMWGGVSSVLFLSSAEQSPWLVTASLVLVSVYIKWGPPHEVPVTTGECNECLACQAWSRSSLGARTTAPFFLEQVLEALHVRGKFSAEYLLFTGNHFR